MRTYNQMLGHEPDFFVKYKLYAPTEGGRKVTFQHLRCDFMYEGDDPVKDGVFMIHPEFLDERRVPIFEGVAVSLEGLASMWILNRDIRYSVHRDRIKIGSRGHFMEGGRKVGDIKVTEIAGLYENPSV